LDAPAFVYALSIMGGEAGEPQFVRPLPPQLEERLRAGDKSSSFEVQLSRGSHKLALAKVGSALDSSTRWYEGIYVFCSSREHSGLHRWMMALREEEKFNDGQPVGLNRARELMPTKTRGGSLSDLSPEQRLQLAKSLATPATERDDVWPFEDPKRFKIYFVKR
jgi:hypothetical protein